MSTKEIWRLAPSVPGSRTNNIHFARILLAEARRDFYWTLLQWAGNARRRAMRHTGQAFPPPSVRFNAGGLSFHSSKEKP